MGIYLLDLFISRYILTLLYSQLPTLSCTLFSLLCNTSTQQPFYSTLQPYN
jgi:hypothetical protein